MTYCLHCWFHDKFWKIHLVLLLSQSLYSTSFFGSFSPGGVRHTLCLHLFHKTMHKNVMCVCWTRVIGGKEKVTSFGTENLKPTRDCLMYFSFRTSCMCITITFSRFTFLGSSLRTIGVAT